MSKQNKFIKLYLENDATIDLGLEFDNDINIRTTSNSLDKETPDDITSIYVPIKEAQEIIIALQDMINYVEREKEEK